MYFYDFLSSLKNTYVAIVILSALRDKSRFGQKYPEEAIMYYK